MGSPYIEIIRELTENLPPLEALVATKKPGYVIYDVVGGKCFGFFMHREPRIAVQRVFVTKGVTIPKHTHGEREWLVIYEGEFMVTSAEGEGVVLKMGDYVVIEPKTGHEVSCLEEGWMLCLTVPAAKGYPHDEG